MNPHAATFRDEAFNVAGTTWAGTICWFPRKPSAFAAVDPKGDREHVLRCGFCQGCRELDRRRLVKRLVAHFKDFAGEIWLTVIEAAGAVALNVARAVRRSASANYESGFLRLSTGAIALVARGSRPILNRVRCLSSYKHFNQRLKRSRGGRAWRDVTAGLLISRDEYGEQVNRFYLRGLPPVEKEKWSIVTRAGITKRHDRLPAGVRGFARGLGLYAPEAWRPPRLKRRSGPESRRYVSAQAPATSIGDVIAKMFDDASASALAIHRDAPTGASPKLTEFRIAAKRPPPSIQARRNEIPAGGYRSSKPSVKDEIAAWLARMTDLARSKG